MSNLNKNNETALLSTLKDLNLGDARNMPIMAGDTYHIVLPTNDTFKDWVKEQTGGWYGIATQEGTTLSVTALTRTGNGIPFTTNEIATRLMELAKMAESVISLQVLKVSQKNAISNEGQPQIRNYYTFQVIA